MSKIITDNDIKDALGDTEKEYFGEKLFSDSGMKFDRSSGLKRLEMVDEMRDKMKFLMNTPQCLRSLPEENKELYMNIYAALGILHDKETEIISFGR